MSHRHARHARDSARIASCNAALRAEVYTRAFAIVYSAAGPRGTRFLPQVTTSRREKGN